MCGIIGINGIGNVIPNTLKGLSRLEYRGYDSAGISFISEKSDTITTIKSVGKIDDLSQKLLKDSHIGEIAISHTRWATHGEVSEANAHPHSNTKVSIVHNGIVENSDALKKKLVETGSVFLSDTDSEVILHLVTQYLSEGNTPDESVRKASKDLDGSYAILALFADYPDTLIATKRNSPLAVGLNAEFSIVSSDSFSMSNFVDKISYLEDCDLAIVRKNTIEMFNRDGKLVDREKKEICSKVASYEKGHFEHYMQKEIFEQPLTSKSTIEHYIRNKEFTSAIKDITISKVEKIYIFACGTSYFAGLIAKQWLQDFLHISTDIEIASEFRYNPMIQNKNNLSIFISQSGETADTARCLKEFKNHTLKSIGIVNTAESTIGRDVDICLPLRAGQEIGVASTKSFTSQLIVLACLTLKVASDKKSISQERLEFYIEQLLLLPGKISELLNYTDKYRVIAGSILESRSVLYIGRGISYAVASEGALKLKELSYIHAESIQAGELKHGPIALIDDKVSVIAIAPDNELINKTLSNVHSIIARKGKVILLSDIKENTISDKCQHHFPIISSDTFTTPMLYNIPLQLISYYAATLSGKNVDQPRNLAKSVTVE
jgi:glucosamine--fructose-6-phosphate aminotransferase (isomerizing)